MVDNASPNLVLVGLFYVIFVACLLGVYATYIVFSAELYDGIFIMDFDYVAFS